MNDSTSSNSQERFEKVVSFLIASVTVLAAFFTYLYTYNSSKGDEADRLSTEYIIQAMQVKASGQTRVSAGWQGAYQNWYELDLQALAAELAGDTAAAQRYRAIRDHIAAIDPIFASPYFDPASRNQPNVARYQADTYIVESTRLSELFAAYNEIGNARDARANLFFVHLTLLAVALSLYGLSTTLHGAMRYVFLGVGSLIAGVVVVWALVVLLLPFPVLSEAAIQSYSNGVGKSWYGDFDGAIREFDSALAQKPDYADAYYERGNAKYFNAYYYGRGDFGSALADYEAAVQAGRDDTSVGWNLGWMYYLVGRFDDAVETDRLVLNRDPGLLGVRFNLALALMARGDFAEAESEYRRGVEDAVREVSDARAQNLQPPASMWYYMDASAQDIDSLILELDGNPQWWSQAPSREAVPADQTQLRGLAARMFVLLRDTTAALEFTGQAAPAAVTASVTPFQFAQEEYDSAGKLVGYNIADSFPYGTDAMVVLFDYSGMVTGQSEVWKVYRDGVEDPTLRAVNHWKFQDSGKGAKPISYAYSTLFVFTPGEYTVELYIDFHLIQRGTFIVEQAR